MKPSLSHQINNAGSIKDLNNILKDCTIKVGHLGGRYIVKKGATPGKDVSVNALVRTLERLSNNANQDQGTEFRKAIELIETLDKTGAEKLDKSRDYKKRLTKLKQQYGSGSYERAEILTKINNLFPKIAAVTPKITPEPKALPPKNPILRDPPPAAHPIAKKPKNDEPTPITPLEINKPHAAPLPGKIDSPIPVRAPEPAAALLPDKTTTASERMIAFSSGNFVVDRNSFIMALIASPPDPKDDTEPKYWAFCPSGDGNEIRIIKYDRDADEKISFHIFKEGETLQAVIDSLKGFNPASTLPVFNQFSSVKKKLDDPMTPIEFGFATQVTNRETKPEAGSFFVYNGRVVQILEDFNPSILKNSYMITDGNTVTAGLIRNLIPLNPMFHPIQSVEEARKHAFTPGEFCADRAGFGLYLMLQQPDKKLFAFCPSGDGNEVRCIIYDPNDPTKKPLIKILDAEETPLILKNSLLQDGYNPASTLKDFANYSLMQKNLGDKLTPIEAAFSTHFWNPRESELKTDDYCLFENHVAKVVSINTTTRTAEIEFLHGRFTIDVSQLKKLNSAFKTLFIPKPEAVDRYSPNEDFVNPFAAVDALGLRSIQSKAFFNKHFSQFDSSQSHVNIGSLPEPDEYEMLTGSVINISEKKLASCGSSPSREIILMDPNRSPLLNAHYTTLKSTLTASLARGELKSEEEVLSAIVDYMRKQVFPSSRDRDLEAKLDKFIDSKRNGNSLVSDDKSLSIPLIEIDEFIKEGLGVCRHHGLALSYFLDKLTKETPPVIKGIAQHMRDNIAMRDGSRGAHVWCTFISTGGTKWHIDSLWSEVIDFTHKPGEDVLAFFYGQQMRENQVRRIGQTYKVMQDRKMILQAPKAATPAAKKITTAEERKFAFFSKNFFSDREGFKKAILKNPPAEKLIAFCPSGDGKNISFISYDPSTDPQVQYNFITANDSFHNFYALQQSKGFKPVNSLPIVFALVSAFQTPTLKIGHELTEIEHGYLTSRTPVSPLKEGDYCVAKGQRVVAQVEFIHDGKVDIRFEGGTITTRLEDVECLIDPIEQQKIINAQIVADYKRVADRRLILHQEIFQGGNFVPSREVADKLLANSINTWVYMPNVVNTSISCKYSDDAGNIKPVTVPTGAVSTQDFEKLIPPGINKASETVPHFESSTKLQIEIGKLLKQIEFSYLEDPNTALTNGDYCVMPIKTSTGQQEMRVEQVISIDEATQKVTLQTLDGPVIRDLGALKKLYSGRFTIALTDSST